MQPLIASVRDELIESGCACPCKSHVLEEVRGHLLRLGGIERQRRPNARRTSGAL
jgi:hypothetical protein